MSRRRKRPGSGLRKLIRSAYKGLSIINTASILLSGNPGKIGRHLGRNRLHKVSGSLIREHR